MKEQEHENHATPDHGHHAGHQAGHHHDFKGIEQWVNRLDNPEREKKQRPHEVIAHLGLQNNDVVADIGAGTGYFALRIAAAYPQVRVIAADPEPEMVDYLHSQATARNLANLAPLLIDPAQPHLPVQANLVLMVDTLHHIDNRVEYLQCLSKHLATGARIAIIDYSLASPEGPPADYRIPVVALIGELKEIGYALVQEINLLPNQYFLIFEQM